MSYVGKCTCGWETFISTDMSVPKTIQCKRCKTLLDVKVVGQN